VHKQVPWETNKYAMPAMPCSRITLKNIRQEKNKKYHKKHYSKSRIGNQTKP
jgi:hypothetical protein